jgi:hypothetical protein
MNNSGTFYEISCNLSKAGAEIIFDIIVESDPKSPQKSSKGNKP